MRQQCGTRWAGRMAAAVPARAAATAGPPSSAGAGLKKESVWDYPRPPALERSSLRLRVLLGGQVLADTTSAYRVCETASPPTYYFPPQDVDTSLLRRSQGRTTFCEWKGTATYWDVKAPGGHETVERMVWTYEQPNPSFRPIAGWFSFYARPPLECWVGEERVQPQEGTFYGGWVTSNLEGPFKGGPGSAGW